MQKKPEVKAAARVEAAREVANPTKVPPKLDYEVRLPHFPTLQVKATSPEGAWEEYKKAMGVNWSQHTPEVNVVTE